MTAPNAQNPEAGRKRMPRVAVMSAALCFVLSVLLGCGPGSSLGTVESTSDQPTLARIAIEAG